MFIDKKWFKELRENVRTEGAMAINGSRVDIKGMGKVILTTCAASGKQQTLELEAAYVPGHKANLISSYQMDENGHVCIFGGKQSRIVLSNGEELLLIKHDRTYLLPLTTPSSITSLTANMLCVIQEGHKRY
eukprot:GHVS01077986.1.p2 GENE.GHVS01077986.1~~GHVS01077986.1.p2  ORF type:complete len:132 (+),score=15.36 GHVS01077986.1:800-1195(+)